MGGITNDSVLSHEDWEDLVLAAESAGRQSARELAQRCTAWELGRTGQVWVQVQPAESPVATWLYSTGRSVRDERGALVSIILSPHEFPSMSAPAAKARSLLVRRAYAEAYCNVLVQEAGVIAEVLTLPDQAPSRDPEAAPREENP